MTRAGIRLVTFDALHTLVKPRLPIHVQYSNIFAPYLGTLEPDLIKRSFKTALRQLQREKPAYLDVGGAQTWWQEVIRRTALGAGAEERAVDASLEDIVPRLMTVFSSKEGYMAFDDALPTLQHLNETMKIRTAIVSNADARMRQVLLDLDLATSLRPIILSEEEGIEKPDPEMFLRAMKYDSVPVKPEDCLHVGDELECDYRGAVAAGMHALLLRRPGPDGEEAHRDEGEDLSGVQMISNLGEVTRWVTEYSRQ